MGLLKKKPILFSKDFKDSNDPFHDENVKSRAVHKSSMPNDDNDIIVKKSQAVFFTVDNILQKLLDNDRFIKQYLEKVQNAKVTKEDALKAFTQDVSCLALSTYEGAYAEHLRVHHDYILSSDSKWAYSGPKKEHFMQMDEIYTKRLKADFSNFDEEGAQRSFLKTNVDDDQHQFEQDVVVQVECDTDVAAPANYVAVHVCNDQTGNVFSSNLAKNVTSPVINQIPDMTQTTYMYRRWLSGLKELFIYIPSTFTFYTEKLQQIGTTEFSDAAHALNPKTRATWIRLTLNQRHFSFKSIYSAEICGQSLPLQIHANSFSYFNDCPQPSILRTPCASGTLSSNIDVAYDDDTNMITLYFCCYGTDAQAIRILAD